MTKLDAEDKGTEKDKKLGYRRETARQLRMTI